MTTTIRLLLAFVLIDELLIGAWNQFWPESFYANFPTVDQTPPFSEHFARDFGGATLGMAFVLLIAVVRTRAHFVVPAAGAFLVFAIPHFVFHALHLEHATGFEAAMLLFLNALVAVCAALAILLTVVRDRRLPRAAPVVEESVAHHRI